MLKCGFLGLLSAGLMLTGCSDGHDDRLQMDQISPAAGIYVPSTFQPLGEPVIIGNTEAIISPTGEARLIMQDGPWFDDVIPQSIPFQVSGPLEIDGVSVNASMRVYPDGKLDPLPLIAEGSIVPGEQISAEYTWGDKTGAFWLSYSDLNNGSPGLDQLEGIWSVTWGFAIGGDGTSFQNLVVTLTIYSDGTAFGSDTSGCTYSGLFSVIGPEHNFYDLELELSSCSERDGIYQGLAFIYPCCGSEPRGRLLRFGTTNDSRSFNASLFGPNYSP